jgi:hypothetical protein
MHGIHTAISKIENSAQVLCSQLKFVHVSKLVLLFFSGEGGKMKLG